MSILVVNFRLNGVSDAQYRELASYAASLFTQVPGLVSKIWLADEESNTYGGIYLFEHREAIEIYLRSELFAGLRSNPGMTDISTRIFDTIEAATAVTQGLLPIVATPISF